MSLAKRLQPEETSMANWIPQQTYDTDSIATSMSKTIAQIEGIKQNSVPNLREESRLVLACDYSGEHEGPKFQVFAYLLAGQAEIFGKWDSKRRTVRQTFFPDLRRIEFKKLADARKQKALGPFLDSMSSINGILFCVAIEKTVMPIGSYRSPFGALGISRRWKQDVFEKLLRISFFGSFLVSGLCRAGQCIHWITDDDEIVANEQCQDEAKQMMSGMLRHYFPDELKEIRLGVASKFEDDRLAEDLVSIADLAAGAFSERINAQGPDRLPKSTNLFVPIPKALSTKTEVISLWLYDSKSPLKKFFCFLRPGDGDNVLVSLATPKLRPPFPGENLPLCVPPKKNWIQSMKSWQLFQK
jgi:hypothetical protein